MSTRPHAVHTVIAYVISGKGVPSVMQKNLFAYDVEGRELFRYWSAISIFYNERAVLSFGDGDQVTVFSPG